jgi:hypothetical protein
VNRKTIFSPCRLYRYQLWRRVPSLKFSCNIWKSDFVQFIGINPSIADETANDRTVSRCIDFASRWGFEWMCMTNLFAFVSTDKKKMLRAPEPIGPENDSFLLHIAAQTDLTVAAWGCDGNHLGRAVRVRSFLPKLYCLRLTKDGHPEHPLYLPKTLTPFLFDA